VNACALFVSDDKLHMNFPYMHCWKILKDQPKWLERRKHINALKPPAKSSTLADPLAITDANGGDVQTVPGAQQRPPEKKKKKQLLRQRASIKAMT
jgi:hypothetical protein